MCRLKRRDRTVRGAGVTAEGAFVVFSDMLPAEGVTLSGDIKLAVSIRK